MQDFNYKSMAIDIYDALHSEVWRVPFTQHDVKYYGSGLKSRAWYDGSVKVYFENLSRDEWHYLEDHSGVFEPHLREMLKGARMFKDLKVAVGVPCNVQAVVIYLEEVA